MRFTYAVDSRPVDSETMEYLLILIYRGIHTKIKVNQSSIPNPELTTKLGGLELRWTLAKFR